MKLIVKELKFLAGRPVCIIHEKTAKKMSLHVGERVSISKENKKIISIIDTIHTLLKQNQTAVSGEIIEQLELKNKEKVEVKIIEKPYSIALIKRKLKGEHLNKREIEEIISNIANNSLTEVEVAFFISAIYTKGMSLEEIKNLTSAMVKSGNRIKLKGIVVDKHSIGGVAGNRTTPIIVSICAAEGLVFPKTSSRAITSASGTADVIETIAKVDFSVREIKKIIKKTNACFVWGGALGLAPVDDKIIRIERIVNIDSTAQLLASILSKKISVGSKYVLIDIPFGNSAKVKRKEAHILKRHFLKLGKIFNLKLAVILTNGSEPIGNGIGPIFEMEDVIKVLKRKNSPKDLEEKSILLAGKLFELTGKAKKGKGGDLAREILESGKAFKKFQEVIKAQKGSLKIFEKNYKKTKFFFNIKSKKNGKIKHLDNQLISKLARCSGCPEDKLAGIYIYKKKGGFVKKGDKIMTVYSLSEEKLSYAKRFYKKNKNIIVCG